MSTVDVRFAAKCEKVHKRAAEHWREGRAVRVWKDGDGVLCIAYKSGRWWRYRRTEGGDIEWW